MYSEPCVACRRVTFSCLLRQETAIASRYPKVVFSFWTMRRVFYLPPELCLRQLQERHTSMLDSCDRCHAALLKSLALVLWVRQPIAKASFRLACLEYLWQNARHFDSKNIFPLQQIRTSALAFWLGLVRWNPALFNRSWRISGDLKQDEIPRNKKPNRFL